MRLPTLEGMTDSGSPSILKVNISPIFASHLVFIPRASENHPQYLHSVKLIEEGLSLFTLFTEPENCLVGFNSIGAFSTINHLHYQLFDLRALSLTEVPGDNLKGLQQDKYYASQVNSRDLGLVSLVPAIILGTHANEGRLYEAFTLSFEGGKLSEMNVDHRHKVAASAKIVLDILHKLNQPFNILIRDELIHIIPRQLETQVTACNLGFGPAMVELYGVFIVKSEELWAKYKDEPDQLAVTLIEVIKKHVSLGPEEFEELKKEV